MKLQVISETSSNFGLEHSVIPGTQAVCFVDQEENVFFSHRLQGTAGRGQSTMLIR